MKLFKKLAAALVATMLVMTMIGGGAISAFAEGSSGTYKVTITGNSQDQGTHTYEAYQIFAGDLSKSGSGSGTKLVLSNLRWGDGITPAGQTALEQIAVAKGNSGTVDGYAKYLTEATIEEQAKEIAKYLNQANVHTGTATAITGLAAGYYLIQDKADSPSGTPSSKTKFIIAVVGDTPVTVKSSVPSVEKKVKDTNDTSGTTTGLQDSADYDIGDTVPYTVTATIGTGIDNYSAYSLEFVDDMTVGLTLKQNSWKIMAGGPSGTEVTNLFKLTSGTGKASGSTLWTWATKNLKSGTTITDGMEIVLTYDCTLNDKAVIGAAGNPNDVKLNFDNNPNSCGEGKPSGSTPEDTNIVFTYKAVVNKVDENQAPLEGAGFTLYKEVTADYKPDTNVKTGAEIKTALKAKNGSINAEALKSGSYYLAKEMVLASGSTTTFEFKGIDDGKYVLVETQIPTGYNAFAAEEFEVKAEHDEDSATPALTDLKGGDRLTGNGASGTLTGDVENKKGATLPSTGGIGTTIFYVLGAILVLGGGVLLVTRRRMAA